MAGARYVDVAVDAPAAARGRLFTYELPPHFAERIVEHQLVWVPLRRELKLAITVRIHDRKPDFPIRAVHAPVEPEFCLSPLQWQLIRSIADGTLCSIFEAASLFLPPGVTHRSVEHLRLSTDQDLTDLKLTTVQRQLIDLLTERGEMSVEAARRALKRSLTTVIDRLEEAGVIERTARVSTRQASRSAVRYLQLAAQQDVDLSRAPAQQRALEVLRRRSLLAGGKPVPWADIVRRNGVTAQSLRALAERGMVEIIERQVALGHTPLEGRVERAIQLTPLQARAWQEVLTALRTGQTAEYLLQGVTGSGKTEIYLRAAAWSLSRGKKVIVLVPEIAIAAQVVDRFASRFPGQVAVLHSALSDSERYQTWKAIGTGEIPIVVGPRSALFAPLEDVGLIVIDEEHEGAYKQDSPPRYHARTIARELSHLHRAVLLQGSATPDVSSYFAAQSGQINLLRLPERVGPATFESGEGSGQPLDLPDVEIIDMRLELQQDNSHIFSRSLQQALHETVDAGEQAILFLNRRGTSTFVQCRSCGHVETCPYCDVPLVFHGDQRQIVCHRCNYRQMPPSRCPECTSDTIGYYGTGTQRVERETRRLLPDARVLRWDQDALKRGVDHQQLMNRVLRHDVDIIVGTQMVAKGLDFPLVSTIGVINADTLLHLPDYKAAERSFQLLTQVAGRAGRRTAGGRVFLQSYTTDHYAVQAASRHDYAGFYEHEIAFRRRYGYPPFRRLVRLVYRHVDELTCQAVAEEIAELLARTAYELRLEDVDLLGPTPAFAAKVRGRYQWQIILRGSQAHRLAGSIELDPGWMVDVDPISLL